MNLCRCNFYYKIHTILFLAKSLISINTFITIINGFLLSLNLYVPWRRIWTEWGPRMNFSRTEDFHSYHSTVSKWLLSEFWIRYCFNNFSFLLKRNETAVEGEVNSELIGRTYVYSLKHKTIYFGLDSRTWDVCS